MCDISRLPLTLFEIVIICQAIYGQQHSFTANQESRRSTTSSYANTRLHRAIDTDDASNNSETPNKQSNALDLLASAWDLKALDERHENRKGNQPQSSSVQIPDATSLRSISQNTGGLRVRRKRNVLQLGEMIRCATGCNPVLYKGYGCYCGYKGSGGVVDGIDQCCYEHDVCYWRSLACSRDPFGLAYYTSAYKWKCSAHHPTCSTKMRSHCAAELCECDKRFVECLTNFPCPKSRPICKNDPLRHWQSLFVGLKHMSDIETNPMSSYEGFSTSGRGGGGSGGGGLGHFIRLAKSFSHRIDHGTVSYEEETNQYNENRIDDNAHQIQPINYNHINQNYIEKAALLKTKENMLMKGTEMSMNRL